MSSREKILSAIRSLTLEPKALPDIPNFSGSGDLVERFTQSISSNKGEVLSKSEFEEWFSSSGFSKVISLSVHFSELATLSLPEDPHALETLEVAILDGQFGVAENGAIWLEDTQLGLRALPFATEHLVIVLDRNRLEDTMHQGYDKIAGAQSGFGLFLAGPSKTADIEQSLVIGAQGAKSLRVVLV
ncbi:MAG: LUD domain-containing protein [Algoriphagus sp.]|jgi:L-lactate dehydrogenase complex protein LldG|uniref:LutC/YkgG family protein n=1 Tax=Algoriphagus sp. TaxID=1872435 RepID=UPI00276A457B|nr:LUD domain-containing protein [Algoriphagus sp.]MDP4903325.1 LUD domain-containing protein [Algoriphagus sp.]MDP4957407.1 LUD domain-containing protein [Algoriphagus sp.]MDP5126166.1 LUD domain-containing protein [Algoriphagus sp.]